MHVASKFINWTYFAPLIFFYTPLKTLFNPLSASVALI